MDGPACRPTAVTSGSEAGYAATAASVPFVAPKSPVDAISVPPARVAATKTLCSARKSDQAEVSVSSSPKLCETIAPG